MTQLMAKTVDSRSELPDNSPLELGIVLYPGMTLLDFAGPQCALGLYGNTHLLWKTLEPVTTDQGISVLPTATFANSRKDFDVLLVPGGLGTADAIRDKTYAKDCLEAAKEAREARAVSV
jgi:cyclohexyl-isocyanide hydratase